MDINIFANVVVVVGDVVTVDIAIATVIIIVLSG